MGILERIKSFRRPKVITYEIAPETLKKIIQDAIQKAAPNITLSQNLASISGTSLTGRDWSQDLAKLQNLDTALSSRASESTLSAIAGALASKATDKLRVSVVDALPRSPFTPYDSAGNELSGYIKNLDTALSAVKASIDNINIAKVSGTALTARDWSQDFAKLQNLDTMLSSRASEATLSGIKAQTDKLQFDASNNLKIVVQNLPTDYFKAGQSIGESPFNLTKIGGTALTARDWSGDLAKLQNLDVALSSRASETTLSGIKSQTDKLTFDASNRLAIQNPPNMDVTLSVLAKLQRFGRNISLSWVDGGEVTAPAAGTALVSRTVTTGKSGYIYGFFISAGEANNFKINWTSGTVAKSRRIVFTSAGTLQYVDFIAINEGVPADGGSTVSITNVNAGSTGIVYQACLLYGEE